MQLDKAIVVSKNYLQWAKTGNHISYEELNTDLFQEALQYLISLAQDVEKEQYGLGSK